MVLTVLAWASMGCGYQLGRAPSAIGTVRLDAVVAPTAEAGLGEDVARAVAREVDRRSALGAGPLLTIEVLEAEVSAVALQAAVQEARLRLRLSVDGRSVVASGRRSFALVPNQVEATASAREAAFEALANELAAEAVTRLLAAP